MAELFRNCIVRASADASTYTVRLDWQSGVTTIADFSSLVGRGVFAAFQDPVFFHQVEIAQKGRVLTWPGEREFDADALWFEAHPEDNSGRKAKQ